MTFLELRRTLKRLEQRFAALESRMQALTGVAPDPVVEPFRIYQHPRQDHDGDGPCLACAPGPDDDVSDEPSGPPIYEAMSCPRCRGGLGIEEERAVCAGKSKAWLRSHGIDDVDAVPPCGWSGLLSEKGIKWE